ncbi:three-helix bundle dimerization domain-containing protein [Mycolicibacterium hodleri]|uniref:three-helix bundle dimerization domain-containing protein n=1 Tax=Mycolicibacterium hodleri TaxID=49897 RepID=UPI003D161287
MRRDRVERTDGDRPPRRWADVVNDCYARFDGRPIRDFVPLFVERGARTRLTQING